MSNNSEHDGMFNPAIRFVAWVVTVAKLGFSFPAYRFWIRRDTIRFQPNDFVYWCVLMSFSNHRAFIFPPRSPFAFFHF